jgi:hypothetical protein
MHNKNSRELLEANRMSTRYYSNYTKESELYKKFARFRNHYMLSSKKTYRAYMAAMLFAFRVIYSKGKDAGNTSQFSAKRKEMTKRIKIYGDFQGGIHGEESEHMSKLFLLDKELVEDYIYPNYSSISKFKKNKIHTHVQKLIDMKVSDFLVIFDATMGWTRFTPNRSEFNKTGQVIDVITDWAQLIQDDLDSKYEVLDNFDLDQIITEIKDVQKSNLEFKNRWNNRPKIIADSSLSKISNRINEWSENIKIWSKSTGGMDIQRKIYKHVTYLQNLKERVDNLKNNKISQKERFLVEEYIDKIDDIMDEWKTSTQNLKESIKVFKQEDKRRFQMIIIQFARHFKVRSSNTKDAV